jgi:hypothetical protein
MCPETVETIYYNGQNIKNFENYTNLKKFISCLDNLDFLVPRFSYGLNTIIINCNILRSSLGELPETVEEIILSVDKLDNSLDS